MLPSQKAHLNPITMKVSSSRAIEVLMCCFQWHGCVCVSGVFSVRIISLADPTPPHMVRFHVREPDLFLA